MAWMLTDVLALTRTPMLALTVALPLELILTLMQTLT